MTEKQSELVNKIDENHGNNITNLPPYKVFLAHAFIFGDARTQITGSDGYQYDYTIHYLPGCIDLNYETMIQIQPGRLPSFEPLTPSTIKITEIDGTAGKDTRGEVQKVIKYAGVERSIIQRMLTPTDNRQLIDRLMTLRIDYANKLYNTLMTKKYDFSSYKSKDAWELDLHLYTLLNNIGNYDNVSLAGIPDIKDEQGVEAGGNGITHKMGWLLHDRLRTLSHLIYKNIPNTMGRRLYSLIRNTIYDRSQALISQTRELGNRIDKLKNKTPNGIEIKDVTGKTEINVLREARVHTMRQQGYLKELQDKLKQTLEEADEKYAELMTAEDCRYIDYWLNQYIMIIKDDIKIASKQDIGDKIRWLSYK